MKCTIQTSKEVLLARIRDLEYAKEQAQRETGNALNKITQMKLVEARLRLSWQEDVPEARNKALREAAQLADDLLDDNEEWHYPVGEAIRELIK